MVAVGRGVMHKCSAPLSFIFGFSYFSGQQLAVDINEERESKIKSTVKVCR